MNRNHKFNVEVFAGVIAPAPFMAGNSYIQTCAELRNAAAYKQDDEFFRKNKNRSHYIRHAYEQEFSLLTVETGFLEIPDQQVHVSRLGVGTYECKLVYYGRDLSSTTLQDDEQVIQLLLKMQREFSGYKSSEMIAFSDRAQENSLAALSSSSKKAN